MKVLDATEFVSQYYVIKSNSYQPGNNQRVRVHALSGWTLENQSIKSDASGSRWTQTPGQSHKDHPNSHIRVIAAPRTRIGKYILIATQVLCTVIGCGKYISDLD